MWYLKVSGWWSYLVSFLRTSFKFNFSFHKNFLSNIGKWAGFTRTCYLKATILDKNKNIFPCKISNFLKFFRKITCSSNKFPDLAYGPSNYLPNISHGESSFRIVIKNLLKCLPGSSWPESVRSQNKFPIVYPWQPNFSRAQTQQTELGQIFANHVPTLVCCHGSL